MTTARQKRIETRRVKRETVNACKCQAATFNFESMKIERSRVRTLDAQCRHWYVTDDITGKLTDVRISPRIGGQARYGVSRASHHSMRSPWNKQGPVSSFEI